MVKHIQHRGPDDQGFEVLQKGTAQVGLGTTRLAILDLSPAGHQPMKDLVTGNWITYNGEIYNYRQLREELNAGDRGRRSEVGGNRAAVVGLRSSVDIAWQSETDTEVILRGYARWGRECLRHLRGMFAFALWDAAWQELFLARDPFGIKPLYYYRTDRLFLFASEVRALLASGLVPRKLNQEGLASYLQFGSVQDPLTIVDGVCSLLPGHCLVVTVKGDRLQVESSKYAKHSFEERENPTGLTRGQAVEILRAELEESIRLHLVSDVPLGAFLSGGIDSSAIVALMTKVAKQRPKTFSVVFPGSALSEAEHARLVAKTFGTEHHEILLSEDRLLALLPSALKVMDQPTMDGINTYVVSKAVKEAGVTVALSGLGGDELFAGYPSFRRAMQLSTLARVPYGFRKAAAIAGRAVSNGSVRRRKLWDMVEDDCSPRAAYAISRQLFSPAEVAGLIGDFAPLTSDLQPRTSRPKLPAHSSLQHQDVINEVSRLELGGYMGNTLLRDTDQMSMAHALEVRVPFVDTEVVRFVIGLPGNWKMDGGRPKPLLLDALDGLLPEEIWKRPKMGFTLPFERWMRFALKPELEKTLLTGNGFADLRINADRVRTLWNRFQKNSGHETWSRPWALYILHEWCHLNSVLL